MSPELGDSDDEELPTFDFLKQQPPSIKSVVQTPPLEENVVVLCSSDSEDSSVASPAWKKPRGSQDSARAPTCLKAIVQLSSESEEDEVIPLAERLKRKLLTSEPSSACPSYTRIRELSKRDSTGGNGLCSIDEKAVTDCGRLSQLPRCQGTQGRAVPSIWELSDSDQELDSLDPKKQTVLRPTVCVSDRLVQNGSCQAAEESLKPLPLQRKTKRNQEEMGKARQRTNERETQKMLQQQERERRKALANRWKAQRPEECLKHIQAVLDPGLLQIEGGGLVLTALQAMECSCVIENQAVPCSITWRRKTGLGQAEEDNWTEEPNLLVLVLLEEFVAMIHNYKQVSMEGPNETLQSFAANVTKKTPGKTLALAVVELEKYFSSHKLKSRKKLQQALQSGSEAQEQSKQRNRRGKANSVPNLSRLDVEEGLVALQLQTGIQVRLLESWKEFADFASTFTKAVAEAPFKRERDKTSFSFCLEGDWIGGMKVDRFGKGLLQVWKRQIQQFNRVSLETANAIVAKYPSPLLLKQAYDTRPSRQERHNLLAEIPVRRGDGVTATTRRVGPELSKRIYLQMTSHNPDLSLDATG
ncbi:crossover junction endonuclease EME1 [Podarcis raffonei]|uniref:crossover junction endonuclease EME1 n=1 Tax=Podarcis raffonei TaxID=65483 RepID=UPI0023291058|nr:crossover junction endonuclease EME1 [Podarcis raffonei]XP_053231765.1 crossover junction endonuclease EME1 [Podarcis raffonei]